jgi:nicotinamidase-related amidase
MRILKEDTVAITVDIQSKLFPSIYDNEKIERNCIKLINGLKIFEIPLIVTEQYVKGLGETIPSIKDALKEDYNPIEKMAFSCCQSKDIMKFIKDFNKTHVILFGIETHVCVMQTALDLLGLGITPVIVEDCVSSRNPNDKKMAIKRLRQDGAIITTLESLLFEICQESGTDEFKQLLKVVK